MAAPLGIYVRVSRQGDREDGRFHSPAEQEARARTHAESRGHLTDGVFSDIDVSGAVHPEKRPEMSRLLEEIREGRLGGIAAFSLDRITRDPLHGDWLVTKVTKAGGVLTAPDMPEDLNEPVDEFTFSTLLGAARLYRRQAGKRFASAKERAILAGAPVGPVPFGYRQAVPRLEGRRDDRTLEERALEVDEEVAPIIRELYERRARGEGYGSLAAWLRSVTDRAWPRQSVAKTLKQPLYATGRLTFGELVSEHDAGAIVDAPLWHAAQSPAKAPTHDRRARSLLSGLLRCQGCDHVMVAWRPGKKASGTRRRYRCTTADCPVGASIRADLIEHLVVERAMAEDERFVGVPADVVDLSALEERAARLRTRWERLQDPEMLDALGDAYASTTKKARLELEEVEAELGHARLEAGVADERTYTLGMLWDEFTADQQRDALAWYVEAVRIGRPSKPGQSRGRKGPTLPEYEGDQIQFVLADRRRPFRMEVIPTTIGWEAP